MIIKRHSFLILNIFLCCLVHAQDKKCTQEDEKFMREKFLHFSHSVIKEKGMCFDMAMQKDLRLFSTDLTTIPLAKGSICFQAGRTYIQTSAPFETKLLLTESKAFEINSAFGKKEFTYYAKVEDTPFRNIASSFQELSEDQYKFWSDFRNTWTCANFEKATSSQVKFINRNLKLSYDHFEIRFPADSDIPDVLTITGNDFLSVDVALTKSLNTNKIEIPDFLSPPAGYEIKRWN